MKKRVILFGTLLINFSLRSMNHQEEKGTEMTPLLLAPRATSLSAEPSLTDKFFKKYDSLTHEEKYCGALTTALCLGSGGFAGWSVLFWCLPTSFLTAHVAAGISLTIILPLVGVPALVATPFCAVRLLDYFAGKEQSSTPLFTSIQV